MPAKCNSDLREGEFCTWPDCSCMKPEKKTSRFGSRDFGSPVRGWREIGGRRIYFRSLWEMNFARVLEWHRANGEPFRDWHVLEWEYEPDTFYFDPARADEVWKLYKRKLKGHRKGVTSYKPDFRIKTYPREIVSATVGFPPKIKSSSEMQGNLFDIHTMTKDSIYFEVKGYMTSKDRTKLKRMKQYYPEIEVIVIDQQFFTINTTFYRAIIPDWESKQ